VNACTRLTGCPFESYPAPHSTSHLPSLVGHPRVAPGDRLPRAALLAGRWPARRRAPTADQFI